MPPILQPPAAAVVLFALLTLAACAPSAPDAEGPKHPDTIPIAAVQGHGERSPLEGREVRIEGIVVLSTSDMDSLESELRVIVDDGYQPSGGWFVQDRGDSDPATSDALYVPDLFDTVLATSADAPTRFDSTIQVGDRIAVLGRVMELAYPETAGPSNRKGNRVSLGAPGGTLSAIEAISIELLAAPKQPYPLQPVAADAADSEAAEGMRLPVRSRLR